jgi:hypothetical protein
VKIAVLRKGCERWHLFRPLLTGYTITGLPEVFTTGQWQKSKIESGSDAVALYHVIYKHEGCEESA